MVRGGETDELREISNRLPPLLEGMLAKGCGSWDGGSREGGMLCNEKAWIAWSLEIRRGDDRGEEENRELGAEHLANAEIYK